MATENATGPTVKYTAEEAGGDTEAQVEVKSPAKNRLTGTGVALPTTKPVRRLPVLFERSASSWWNLRFDTKVLEEQHAESSFPQTRRRFHMALTYIITASTFWCIFFAAMQEMYWIYFVAATIALLVFTIAVLFFTFTKHYQKLYLPASIIILLTIYVVCLLGFFTKGESHISGVGIFATSVEILLMVYTVIPMPLYLCVILGVLYSVIYEVLSGVLTNINAPTFIAAKIFMHLCIHLIGIHIYIMSEVRKRSTFLKVGQSVMSRRELQLEKQLTQKMIDSLMPHTVALEVMASKEEKGRGSDDSNGRKHGKSPSLRKDVMAFRSFHMSQMHNVSILFADIAGFTKMSSNKTAEHLVALLNDLFGRFDELCTACGCEKISTLGDCYYCVSGCPEARPDHAKCCVEMGLGMIKAIKEFDEENNESVNMRVGIHTGTVLCGIVGTKRFKFDVWSNDVTLANMMESEGEPGKVHISGETYKFLKDEYSVRDGKKIKDIRHHKVLIEYYNEETNQYQVRHIQGEGEISTFFIVDRKEGNTGIPLPVASSTASESPKPASPDAVQIKVERQTSTQERETTEGDVEASATNHVEGQANGMTTAALLGRRENIQLSMENLAVPHVDQEGDRISESSLMPIRKPREQTDQQLIKCIKEDKGNQDYFYKPPINQCTLNFQDKHHECHYRDHYLDDNPDTLATFAAPRFSALFDMFVSVVVLVALSICCFLAFPVKVPWLVVFVIALVVEFVLVVPLFYGACLRGPINPRLESAALFFSGWYPRHVFGIFLTSLPVLAVYANFSCSTFKDDATKAHFYCLLVIVALLHYCNFTMLSSWMKSCLATLAGVVLVVLLFLAICKEVPTDLSYTTVLANGTISPNITTSVVNHPFTGHIRSIKYEMIVVMLLLLLLIWFLNRQFEISYRLSFHGDYEAQMDREKMAQEKERTDWLLHNIVPEHVSQVLRVTSKYSKTHSDVGVIFAKITNFDEFYDESFEGGREYLRVLNELMGDFEELLDREEYKNVEKIKTIGSCFMAASGLNQTLRNQNKNPNAHLYALMDFACDLLRVVDEFNVEIFNFDFEMSIGLNYGEVTAGVIGTTKLLYDIWGDTVNISSRMYSTGVSGRIQVTEDTANKLGDIFEFEHRGQTAVKGKGIMNTYLLKGKKPGATW